MFVVVMCGGEPHTPNFRRFDCHYRVWLQILELAKERGWKPLGTTPDGDWGREYFGSEFNGDYVPGDAGKIISAEDGRSLAEALERAIANPPPFPVTPQTILIVENMTEQDYGTANAPLSVDLLKTFVRFLHNGEFCFFWDD
jgi:hypothetical protein